jgi:hypothetical protein
VRWKFLYEAPWDRLATSEIDRALTVIIGAHDEKRWL